MRTIQRNVAPTCLDQQPKVQDWGEFIGTPCHVEVDGCLRQEQQGLCCYCEAEAPQGDSHIEHIEPRCRNKARHYDYANLALSCNGGTGEHCGHYKDNRNKNPNHTWNSARFALPHDPATALLVHYLPNGNIAPTQVDTTKATYLIGYLGLNCARLNERRKQHAHNLIDTLGDQPDPAVVNWLRQDYLQADTIGRLKPFHSLSKVILEP